MYNEDGDGMKKRGFTLVELLAVLVLIAAISLIVFPSIINYVNSSKGDINEVTEKLIIDSAKLYVDNNKTLFPEVLNTSKCFTLQDLIDSEYLEKTTLNNQASNIDPHTTYIQADYVVDNEIGVPKYNLRLLNKCIVYGDVNLDGTVDSTDFDTLKSYIKGETELSEEALLNADVNVDGKVSAYDLTVLKYTTITDPLITSLPYSIDTSKYVYGDLDLDGQITTFDLRLVAACINGNYDDNYQRLMSDLNIDGETNSLDISIIGQYISGEITELPKVD